MQGWELAVVAGVLLLLFGGSRLPKLARSLGEARTELAKVRSDDEAEPTDAAEPTDGARDAGAEPPVAAAPAPAAPTTVDEPLATAPAAFAAPVVTPMVSPSLPAESVVVAEPARSSLPPPLPPPG